MFLQTRHGAIDPAARRLLIVLVEYQSGTPSPFFASKLNTEFSLREAIKREETV